MNTTVKSVVFWVAMLVLVGLVWNFSSRLQRQESNVSFTEFVNWVDSGQVATVTITGNELTGQMLSKEKFRTTLPTQYEGLVNRLLEKKVIVVPGHFFDVDPGQRRVGRASRFNQHVRFSFGPSEETIDTAVARLTELVRGA